MSIVIASMRGSQVPQLDAIKKEPVMQSDIIQTIVKDSNYHLALFTDAEVQALRAEILIQIVN